MHIRPATPDDLPSMVTLERQCPTAGHWTREQYRRLFQPSAGTLERVALVADGFVPGTLALPAGQGKHSSVLGFLIARHLAPEWELENIVVAPAARRTRLGKGLLGTLLTHARETNSNSVFLEVRESNRAARALYEKAGFLETGRRKSYYAHPSEDAILYRLTL